MNDQENYELSIRELLENEDEDEYDPNLEESFTSGSIPTRDVLLGAILFIGYC